MSNTNKNKSKSPGNDEAEQLYELYIRVQSGDESALNELFTEADSKHICRLDEMNKEYRLSHMDNVLDSEFVLDSEKSEQEKEWLDSANSKVIFQFPCLNKMLYKKKKKFISKAKSTGYENKKKKKNYSHSKFYEGEYDISDFNELMYETVIEIFNSKTDENNCLTLDGKRNEGMPICDGVSLLKNISYFTSRKINKRAETSYLDITDMDYSDKELEIISYFDKYAMKEYLESEGGTSRLMMYEEYLEWLKENDIHKLFKATACEIKAIIETIMNCDKTFIADTRDGIEKGPGMRFVTQIALKDIIKSRYNINIAQENISKDLEIIEQRLLDHLFYSLNLEIRKADKSEGIYEKESERYLYELDNKAYIKMFNRTSYKIYAGSIMFVNSDINVKDFNIYFDMIIKHKEMILGIISKEKRKKKYDMVNLISDKDYDLVDDKKAALLNIANTMVEFYQKREEEYIRNHFGKYKIKSLKDCDKGLWEAELEEETVNIRLWSSKEVKFPIHCKVNRENVIVYCGYMNFYFCDKERMICYKVPKDRRIIGRYNKKHKFFIYYV